METNGIDWELLEDTNASEYVNDGAASVGDALQVAYMPEIGPIRKMQNALHTATGSKAHYGTPKISTLTLTPKNYGQGVVNNSSENDDQNRIFGDYRGIPTHITPHEDTLNEGMRGGVGRQTTKYLSDRTTTPKPWSTVGTIRWTRQPNSRLYTMEEAVIPRPNTTYHANEKNIPRETIEESAISGLERNISDQLKKKPRKTSAPKRSYAVSR